MQELWRGFGTGTRLLSALHARARALDITQLSLSVEGDNRALRLYERLGYAELRHDSGTLTMLVNFERR